MANKPNMFTDAPKAMKLMIALEQYLKTETTLGPINLELIKMRVSQINGCAYCLNMHVIDALKYGETEQRIHLLPVWRETDLFTPQERLILELAERVTLISEHAVDESLHAELSKYFSRKEVADLLIAIAQINSWNRYNIALHTPIDKNYK